MKCACIIAVKYAAGRVAICGCLCYAEFVSENWRCKEYFPGLRRQVGDNQRIPMSIDVIGNFLTIIRNSLMRSKLSVVVPYSRMREAIAKILKEEGFIRDYVILDEVPTKKALKIYLKYVHGESVIHEIKRVSTPGRRRYVGVTKARGFRSLDPVIGGLGLSVLTTSHGIISHKKAKELGVGGEVICTVW